MIGLVSKLTTPEGGFDADLSYTEYARELLERNPPGFAVASYDLEQYVGSKRGNRRFVVHAFWMANQMAGVIPTSEILAAARRAGVTEDLGAEVDRITLMADEARKKAKYLNKSSDVVSLQRQLDIAVDAVCRCR